MLINQELRNWVGCRALGVWVLIKFFHFSQAILRNSLKNQHEERKRQTIKKVRMEKFSLKFNDFASNVTKSFQSLRKEQDFFDVTLVGDDLKHVTAHKLVLASCSEYFKTVFSNNKKYFQSQAMICLEGLNHGDLNNVLDYIYQGEVQIQQNEIDRFLQIADRLKLEGLMKGRPQEDEVKTENIFEFSSIQDNLFLTKNENQLLYVETTEKPVLSIISSEIQSLEELDQKVEDSYTKIASGIYSCDYSKKSFKSKSHVKRTCGNTL